MGFAYSSFAFPQIECSRNVGTFISAVPNRSSWPCCCKLEPEPIHIVRHQGDDSKKKNLAILFCYGTLNNLQLINTMLRAISFYTGLTMVGFDYPGRSYKSKETCTENRMYEYAIGVYDWMKREYPEQEVIVLGYSVGAAVAAHVASARPVKGVFFVSPVSSILNYFLGTAARFPGYLDCFETTSMAEKYAHTWNQVVILHGGADTIVKPWHGHLLYGICQQRLENVTFVIDRMRHHGDIDDSVEFRRCIEIFYS